MLHQVICQDNGWFLFSVFSVSDFPTDIECINLKPEDRFICLVNWHHECLTCLPKVCCNLKIFVKSCYRNLIWQGNIFQLLPVDQKISPCELIARTSVHKINLYVIKKNFTVRNQYQLNLNGPKIAILVFVKV